MSKKILFFFSVTRMGGAETTFVEIIKNYKNNGHECFAIAVIDNGNLGEFLSDLDVPLKILNFTKFNFIYSLFVYRNYIRKNKIELVFNLGLKVELFSRLFSKLFGVKYIISNIRSTDPWRKWYHTCLDKITAKNTDMWVSNSIAGSKVFQEREGINKEKIQVIYNVSSKLILPISKIGIKDKITLGILSNIKKGKGFKDLGQIVKKLNNLGVETNLLIGGVDLLNGEIFKFYNKIDIENKVTYLGYIKDKKTFFESIDVFILPSYWEGLPTSILESIKYGVPVVSTNVGGVSEIISDNNSGLLFLPGDIDCAVMQIQRIIDRDLYFKIRKAGLNEIKSKFRNDNLFNKWNDILNYE